jgi:hypothetical protein
MRMADVLISLRPRDPVFAAIHAALRVRLAARDMLRPLIATVRKLRARGPGSPS